MAEYAQAAERYLGAEQAGAYLGSLPADVVMGRIAVRPDAVVVLDFETRFPSAPAALQSVPSAAPGRVGGSTPPTGGRVQTVDGLPSQVCESLASR